MTRFTYRHQYDDERDAKERAITDVEPGPEMITEQHHAEDADINVMVRRFGIRDGAILPAAMDPRYFGDFTDAIDLRTALDRTREARDRFNQLPADLRNRFNNDPAELYAFVSDERNNDAAVELGLLSRVAVRPESPAPAKTPAQETPPE